MFKKKFPSLSSLGSDGNTSFLRAARAGHLDKVLEQLKNNVDINTSNANGLNALHLASKDGHIHVVTELLKRGANVDSATKKGNTALHIASLAGQEEVVKLLVEHGASVNVQSQNGFTPLYMAAQENHDNVVKFLLSNGANQSLATEDGFTPLAVAMQQGHDKVVAVLLENDTRGKVRLPALHIAAKKDDCKAAALLLQNEHNPDVTSKSGFTPLHIASHYGNQDIANLLLNKGADVNYSAKHNITPLHVAAKWGKSNMVGLLLEKGANIESKTRDGLTPLHCAARSGHEQVVDMLLERGAPISSKTKNGLAPLHMSSQGDHVDAARILLYHRAPVDEVTVDYLTALHVAAHCGHARVAKLLLDRKADPNARALNGFTPLHIACKKNRIKVVELLLKHGASIEATTESGLTPLHVASFMGCMNIVIYLLQNEANPDVPTVRGETPLHLAARANQTDIIRILLRNGAQVDARAREQQTPLHIAARLGNVDIVMLLLQHGAAVDSTTKDLYTALHIAAKEGQDEVAQVLLENGASPTATTKKGFTPLHLASKYGNMKVASLLLQRDAPVDAQGKNGVTPLHVASHYDHQNVALLLLDKGASPHATAKNGHTPLHIAAKKNQMDIATTLLEYGAKADIESKAGFTPLHLSAQEGHIDMTSILIDHQADTNHKAKNGLTPLHLCAQEDRVNVATVLVKNGAEVDATTKAGYTPLHVASHFGQINMVRFLVDEGAKVGATTAVGYTPLHQAAQQGHSTIVNTLLESGAPPNATTNQGQTALSIAQKLGYISVVESLKGVTEPTTIITTTTDEKYKVVSPETMQETFMSDSEDEGGEDTLLSEQPYRYLTVDEMKSLGDDSLPIDVTRDERADSNRECMTAPPTAVDDTISPQHLKETYSEFGTPDNIDIGRHPLHVGFLVSFLVDARGGAMRGCRHSGVRVIVPPRRASQPMRVTCRYLKRDKLSHPPPLMEGEALASRILELGPVGAKFLGPVMIEVPHFGSLRGKEREIVILRSDNGETWREHTVDANEDAVQDILSHSFDKEEISQLEDAGRTTRILTTDFPHYFAVVTRVRQEVHAIGPEGGMVSSSVVPQVQAVFPQGALTKKIKVGLQAQPIPAELAAKLLGNRVAVSPIVTVEPRRRKFHKPITLTIPKPQTANKGMINQYSGDAPTLRLLCSITGGTTRAQWEDVTGSTPFTFVNDCVSFTTTVSARFWLMDCRNVVDATKMATELYREAIHVPFMAKFVVFAKRVAELEARLRVFCMTDDKEDKTLEHQEHFTEVAKSRDVEVLEGKSQYVEFAGNLIPVTKSGEQLQLGFRAFRENRLPFTVRVKDPHADTIGRTLFMREPKVPKGEPPQQPICILNIVLPEEIIPETGALDHELHKYNYIKDSSGLESYQRADLRLSDISNLLGEDWVRLAGELNISTSDINRLKTEYPNSDAQQGLAMLRLWLQKAGNKAQANTLEAALSRLGRDDIIQQCVFNIDQTGFDLLKEELGPSRDASLKRDIRVDNVYTGQDIIKDSGSIELSRLPHQKAGESVEKDDKEERKYLAEEKEVEEKKSVSERRKEIEERLLQDKEILIEKSVTKVVEETITTQKQKIAEDLTEKEIAEEMKLSPEEQEPSDLTFEQKRLSFEQGKKLIELKPDKKKVEVEKEIDDKFISEEIKIAECEIDETSIPFQEKRLSFERGLKAAEQKREVRSVDDQRRDSELFEGVSQGLVSLDSTFTSPPQDLLSPKVSKTPPPSPAEFKDTTGSAPWPEDRQEPQAKIEPIQDWATKRKPDSGVEAERLGASQDEKHTTLRNIEVEKGTKDGDKTFDSVIKPEENALDFSSFYECDTILAVKSFIEAESAAFVNISAATTDQTKISSTEKLEVNLEVKEAGMINKTDEKLKEYSDKNDKSEGKSDKSFVGKVSKKIFGVFKKDSHKDKSGKGNGDIKDKSKGKSSIIDVEKGKEKIEDKVTIETVLETGGKVPPVIPEKGRVTFSETVSDIVVKSNDDVFAETEKVATDNFNKGTGKINIMEMESKETLCDVNNEIKNINNITQTAAHSIDDFKRTAVDAGETNLKTLSDAKDKAFTFTKSMAVKIVEGNDNDKHELPEHHKDNELGNEQLDKLSAAKDNMYEITKTEPDKLVASKDQFMQDLTQSKEDVKTKEMETGKTMAENLSKAETKVFKITKLSSDKVAESKNKAAKEAVQMKEDFQIKVLETSKDVSDKLLDTKDMASEMKESATAKVFETGDKISQDATLTKDDFKNKVIGVSNVTVNKVLDVKEESVKEIICAKDKVDEHTKYTSKAVLDKLPHYKEKVFEEAALLKEGIDNKAVGAGEKVSEVLSDTKITAFEVTKESANKITENKENITKEAVLRKEDFEHKTGDFNKTLSEKLILEKDKALGVTTSAAGKMTEYKDKVTEATNKIFCKSVGDEIMENKDKLLQQAIEKKEDVKEKRIETAKDMSEKLNDSVEKIFKVTQDNDLIKKKASEKLTSSEEKSDEISDSIVSNKTESQDKVLIKADMQIGNIQVIDFENSLKGDITERTNTPCKLNQDEPGHLNENKGYIEPTIDDSKVNQDEPDHINENKGYIAPIIDDSKEEDIKSNDRSYQLSDIKHIAKDIVDETLEKLSSVFPERQVKSETVLNTPSIETLPSEISTTIELSPGHRHLNEPNISNAKKEDEKFTNMLIDMLIEQESMNMPVLEDTDSGNTDSSNAAVTSTDLSKPADTLPKTGVEETSKTDDSVKLLTPKSQKEHNLNVSSTKFQSVDLRSSASDNVLEYFCNESESEPTKQKQSEEHIISYVTTPTLQRRGIGGSQRLSREERPALRDVSHLLSESSSDEEENAYIVTEPIEKSPQGQRKVTFRFDSEEDPHWESSSDSDIEIDVQEMTPSPIPPIGSEEKACLNSVLEKESINETEANNKIKRVERKFERMASETLEASGPAESSAVDHEFQRMISQLSNKEVDACLTAWDEGGLTPSSELDSKDSTSGDLDDGLEQLPQASILSSRNPFDVSDLINLDEEGNDVPSSMFWAFENVPTRNSVVELDDLDIPIIRKQTKGNQFSDQCLTQVNRESLISEISPESHLKINTLGSNSCCRAPSPVTISVRHPCNLLDSPLGYIDPHSAASGSKDESSADEVKKTSQSTTEIPGAREGEENLFELAAGFRDTPPSEDDPLKKPPPPKSQ